MIILIACLVTAIAAVMVSTFLLFQDTEDTIDPEDTLLSELEWHNQPGYNTWRTKHK